MIHSKSNDCRTIFFDDGQHTRKHFWLAIDRIYNRLAIDHTQASRKCIGIGGVDLQRQIGHGLDRLDHTHHHFRFIHTWKTHIDIQNMRPCVRLLHRLRQYIIQIVFTQRLLKAFLARWVDTFSNHTHTIYHHSFRWRTYDRAPHNLSLWRCLISCLCNQFCDKIGAQPTVMAEATTAKRHKLCHILRKLLWRNAVYPSCWIRQSGICFDNEWQCGKPAHSFHNWV